MKSNNEVKNIRIIYDENENQKPNIEIKIQNNLVSDYQERESGDGFNSLNYNEEFEYGFNVGGKAIIRDLLTNQELITLGDEKIVLHNNQKITGLADGKSDTDAINKSQLDNLNEKVIINQENIDKNSQNIELINQSLSQLNLSLHAEALNGRMVKGQLTTVLLRETFNNYEDLTLGNSKIYNRTIKERQELTIRASLENSGAPKVFELYLYKYPIFNEDNYLYKSRQTLIASAIYLNSMVVNLEDNSVYILKYFLENKSGDVITSNGKLELSGNIISGGTQSVATSQLIDDSETDPDAPVNQKLNQIAVNQNNIEINKIAIGENTTAISLNTTNITVNTEAINTNTTNIGINSQNISDNTTAIQKNMININANTDNIGDLKDLNTSEKSNLVASINQLNSDVLTNTQMINDKIQEITDISLATELGVLYLIDGTPIKKNRFY